MIAIIDYGMGNVRSVYNALDYVGEKAEITADAGPIERATRIVLPGVGAFGDAMANLKARRLDELLFRQVFEKNKPFLGICLGLQLLAKSSTEHGSHTGLGWLDANVVKFDNNGNGLKVPHMGWNEVIPEVRHPLMANLPERELTFYFVHSFYMVCHDSKFVAATCEYGVRFTAAVFKDNLFACQFHPEKSQDNGVRLLKNFAVWRP